MEASSLFQTVRNLTREISILNSMKFHVLNLFSELFQNLSKCTVQTVIITKNRGLILHKIMVICQLQ